MTMKLQPPTVNLISRRTERASGSCLLQPGVENSHHIDSVPPNKWLITEPVGSSGLQKNPKGRPSLSQAYG